MRLGLFMMPLHPPTRDYHEMLEEDFEAVLHADEVGFDEVWIGDQPGKLFAGLGHRFAQPQTFYGTIGLFFDNRSRDAGGVKLAIGRDYVNLGIVWGWDLTRILRRR